MQTANHPIYHHHDIVKQWKNVLLVFLKPSSYVKDHLSHLIKPTEEVYSSSVKFIEFVV